jgi:hypothetical protein
LSTGRIIPKREGGAREKMKKVKNFFVGVKRAEKCGVFWDNWNAWDVRDGG